MANRMFTNQQFTLEKAPVKLWARVSIGSTGAPTLSRGKGIASISRTSAGLYVITLSDVYVALLNATCTQLKASGFLASPIFHVVAETVASTKTITVQFSGPTASGDTALKAVEVDQSNVLFLEITLSNSSAT